MGSGCSSSSLAQGTDSCGDGSPRPPRRHRFTSVVDKDDLPESQAVKPNNLQIATSDSDFESPCNKNKPQLSLATSPRDQAVDIIITPVASQRGTAAPARYALLEVIDAEQNLSMSRLAGPMMDSKATTASESITLSGNTSALSTEGTPLQITMPSANIDGGLQNGSVCDTSCNNKNKKNNNNNNNNNNSSATKQAWDLSLSSVPSSTLPSPAAAGMAVSGGSSDSEYPSVPSFVVST